MLKFRAFEARDTLSFMLAEHISGALKNAIAKRGNATLVVSGGTSPVMLFHALRRQVLPWRNVTVVPSDERLVPVDHKHSNEGMIRRELMCEKAAMAQFLSLVTVQAPDDEHLMNLNSRLDDLPRPLDMVVLGMGLDGHTASLFPDSPNIAEALTCTDHCVAQYPAHIETGRISLSPALLLNAREIILLFFGSDKRAVYELAMADRDVAAMPVRFLLNQSITPVHIFWAP